jgi:hypothetical protein
MTVARPTRTSTAVPERPPFGHARHWSLPRGCRCGACYSSFTAQFGIDEFAYTGEGASDGVTFRAVLRVAGEAERELFRRHLDPKSAPATGASRCST